MTRPVLPLLPLLLALLCAPATGQDTPRAPVPAPAQPLAYIKADPSKLSPPAAWLPTFIQLLQVAGVVPRDEQPVADGLLAATFLGTYPFEVILLDLRADRFVPRDINVHQVKAVLVLEAPGRFPQLRQALQTVLSRYGQPAQRIQRIIDLPHPDNAEPRKGVTYRLDNWPQWMAVEWSADEKRFYLGVGGGALASYFAFPESMPADARIDEHRHAVELADPRHGQRPPMLELFADVGRLRAAAPTLFATGRTTPLLQTLGLADAQQVMLHGRWADTFLLLDLTTRTDGVVTHKPLSLDHWPERVAVPKPPGRLHIVAPIQPRNFAQMLLRIAWLAHEIPDRAPAQQRIDHYTRQVGPAWDGCLDAVEPYLLVSDYPPTWLPIPGTATLYFPLASDDPQRVEQTRKWFTALMAPLLKPPPLGDTPLTPELGVVLDPATGVHYLDSPLRGLFKAPAWAWWQSQGDGRTRAALIAGYSPQAVLMNRQWLDTR